MGTNDKMEERKHKNAPVLAALEHLKRSKGLNQNEVCALLGCNSSLISGYKSGKIMAGDDFKGRLIDAFGGRLNIPFLYGESDVLLVENLKPAPSADSADGRVRDLQEQVANLEELVATQRLLIETLRDRLRSLGVEYVAPALPSRRSRPYVVGAATSSSFSLPAAESGDEHASEKPGNASPSDQGVSPKSDNL